MNTRNVLGFAAAVLALAFQSAAQINSGVITGTVSDPKKAVVPGAKVLVVEDSTQFTYSATTNADGEFTVPYLKAGAYSVTATANGFPAFHVTGINIAAGGTVRI